MFRRFSSFLGSSTVLTTALFLGGASVADGHGGGHGGAGGHGGGAYHGGAYHGGYYHGYYGPYHPYYGHGFYPHSGYGFYRPYYGYGLGALGVGALGFGAGLGLGLGLGGYGSGGGYGPYLPYAGVYGGGPSAVVANTPGVPTGPAGAPPAETAPQPDNAVHLQIVVPENAEVLFDGEKTNQTGPLREFVSPQLTSGKVFNYTITVRYTDADGKPINDKRVIYVRANDWFRIDFTRPAPPEQTPAPQPRPE